MFKLMIVDDEPEIRSHIKSAIAWEKLSLLLVAEAGDADTAIENAMLFQPQIVVMDICLPGRDGLSLAAELKAQDPEIQILIISGFQDFSYAQKAMGIGVSSFLTKPILPKEVNGALQRIVNSFLERKTEQQKMYAVNQVLKQNRQMLQQWQLESLLQGETIEAEQVRQQMRLLDMELGGEYCTALLVCGQKSTDSTLDSGFQFAMSKQYLEIKLQEAGFKAHSYFDEEKVLNILLSNETRLTDEKLENLCITLRNEIKMYFGMRLYMGLGSTVDTPAEIGVSAKQARAALQHSLMLSEERVVTWSNIRKTQATNISSSPQLKRRWLPRIIECVREGREVALGETLDRLIGELQSQVQLREFGVEFLGEISRQCSELGIFPWNAIDYPTVVRQLFDGSSADEFKESFMQLCKSLSKLLSQQDSDANRYLILKAKKYIEDNYTDPELSLEQVSDYVGLSRSYFCSLFHKVEHKTFKSFLMDLRIRQAKLLLVKTDKKIYEIGCDVGCSDAAYFNRVFKRITGTTPLQYRNNNGS